MPTDEESRLARLRGLLVLDTPPEPLFDSIARMASEACGVPIALLSLVDGERQWFKANVGLPGVNETPRDIAFCAHAIGANSVFEVADARQDPRFADNPLVCAAPDIRFYAGAPLVLADGARVGTLCVIDRRPHRLLPQQLRQLEGLARIAVQALEMRRELIDRSLSVRSDHEQALRASQSFLARTGRVAGVGGWEFDLARGVVTWSEETRRIHEVAADFEPTLESAIAFYAPEARPQIMRAVERATAGGPPWDLELPFVTARGRRIWVRAVGEAEFEDGRAVRLVGAFQDISERKRLQAQLAESERFLRDLTDSLPVRIAYLDDQRRNRFVNRRHCERFNLPRDQIIGRTRAELLGSANSPAVEQHIDAVLRNEAQVFEFTENVAGQPRCLESRLVPDMGDDGRVRGFFSTSFDITERARAQHELQRQSAILNTVAEAIPAIVSVVDRELRYRFVNGAFERWYGLPRDRVLGREAEEIMPAVDVERSMAWARRALAGEAVYFERDSLSAGALVHLAVNYVPIVLANGTVDGFVGIAQDITHHRIEQHRLRALAQRDALTGLLNRAGFDAELQRAVEEGEGSGLALLYVDLDHFKPVNDQHGHPVGDLLLQQVAQRLRSLVRPTDAVARLGGDEFGLLLFGIREPANALAVADKIVEALQAPFMVGERSLAIGASVGVAVGVDPAGGAAALVARADAVLYRAKLAGRGRRMGEAG